MKNIKQIVILLFAIICSSHTSTTFKTITKDYSSKQTSDKYKIIVTLPKDYNSFPSKKFPVVYYADATLISGQKTKKIAQELMESKKIKSCILVGIGHYGNYNMKRRRDYIQAHQKSKSDWYSDDKEYGQSQKFYQFLKKELLPYTENNYRASSNNRTFSGHSLSGLFCAYSMLQSNKIFKNYIALSPSIWVNYQNLFSFERLYYANYKKLSGNLFMTAGGLEVANLVLYNVNQYDIHINKRKYNGLNMKKKIYSGKTHMSALDQGIKDGLLMMLR